MRKPILPFLLYALLLGMAASAQVPVAPEPKPIVSPAKAGGAGDGPPIPGEEGGPGHCIRRDSPDDATQATPVRPPAIDHFEGLAPTPKDDKPPPAPKDPKAEALDKELSEFQKNVTLGNWPVVKTYIASLPDEEAAAAYRQLLKSLQQRPGMAGRPPAPAVRTRWRRR